MSLFEQASLVVTPNAYKSGKLYSIKPTDGSGDLDVVRATSATRVNENGLIEIPRTNLLLRSEEFNDAYWGLSNATILLNATNAPNGTLTADKIYPNSTGTIRGFNRNTLITLNSHAGSIFAKWDGGSIEILTLTRGSLADISFNVKTGQIVGTIPTGMTASITSFSNGWYRCSWAYNSANTLTFYQLVLSSSANSFSVTANGTDGIFIWGAQLELGNVATEYIPTTSVIRTRFAGITQDGGSANNIPRLDYTNASCPSILVEPQRTNLALYSEEFDNAAWLKFNSSVTANQTTSPDGTTNADKIIENNVSGFHSVYVSTPFSVTSGQSYSRSVYAKADGRNWISLLIIDNTQYRAFFDLQNGVVGNVSSGISATIENVGNGWYRCIITRTATTTLFSSLAIELASANGTGSYTGNGTSGVFIWGSQLEVGSNATSYIPTVASAVTRNADVISKTGISSLINSVEGSLFLEYKALLPINSLGTGISLSNGTNSQLIFVNNTTTANRIIVSVVNSNGANFNFNVDGINYNNKIKILCKWMQGSFKIFYNGTLIVNNTTFNTFNSNAMNEFSFRRGDGQRLFEGNFEKGIVFPVALTDQQCINLTTL